MTPRDRLSPLIDRARAAPTITLHMNAQGEIFFGAGLANMLTDGDQVEAVARIMIERMRDPDAPPDEAADAKEGHQADV